MHWKELKESLGFRKFKGDYIRIFNKHHSELLKKVDGFRHPRIFKNSRCEEQSILNYINTNILAYSILVNETLTKISFDPLTIDGYETMMNYIIDNKWFWLGILPKITDKIEYTSSLGSKKENLVKDKLTDYFNTKGNFEVISIGGLGNINDMVGGYDITIKNKKNGKEYKAQVKTCTSIILNNDLYDIKYTGVNKLYKGIDYMICVVENKVHVFDNKMVVKNNDGYQCIRNGLRMVL